MAGARLLVCLVAVVALAGCAENNDEAEPTQPARTTNAEIVSAVWERSYSECSTESVDQLAGKYNVEHTLSAVAVAVAVAWKDRLKAGDDAIASGAAGCRKGAAYRSTSAP